MKKIIFMRHSYALSVTDAKVANDDLRPLSTKGIEEAQNAVVLLKHRAANVDRIITSPRLRALQTAEIIGQAFETKPEAYPQLAQEIPLPDLWKFIRVQVDEGSSLLVVGHNPEISTLVGTLTGTHISLNPAEFAIVKFDNNFETPHLVPINPQEEENDDTFIINLEREED